MKPLRSLLIFLFLITAGCAGAEVGSGLLSGAGASAFAPPPGPATLVTVAELAEEPESFAGQYVQVMGQFRLPAVVVCDAQPRRSPSGWILADENAAIEAGGFDELLRSLLPQELTITVAGRWQYWRGPVGCGKTAPVREVWYLAVREIVEPQPLARVTLTPPGGVTTTAVAIAPLPTSTPAASPTPSSTPTVEPGATTPASPVLTATASATVATATLTPTATATQTVTATLTATITRGGTTEPTSTLDPADATATAAAQGTPQPTATEPSGTIIDRGALTFRERLGNPLYFNPIALEIDELAAEEGHRWEIEARAGDVISLSAVSQPDRDIVLQLRDAAGNILVTRDATGTGEVEVIAGFTIPTDGSYRAVVREANGVGTYYTVLYVNVEHENYYEYEIAGTLPRNGSRTTTMPEKTDYLWAFVATGGSTISITVAPNDSTDPILNLLNPEGALILEYVNDRGPGQSEIILNFQLEDSGLYVLHVGEDQYAASSYRVTVSGN
ncbi:MAG: hypothetical protein RRC07_03630 [Anaerolineae bacterium]|nr:hypothetical protein [Anaerolineae bacterium]